MAGEEAWFASVPRVRTARLLLREPRLADFEAFAANAADPLACAHLGGRIDRRDAWRRFHSAAGGWVVQGMGWWTVEAPNLGSVGTVGVFRRENSDDAEIGWIIHREWWGLGYASEAAGAALNHATVVWQIDRVIAHIAEANTASIGVARKIGMRCEGASDFYGDPDLLYSFTKV